MNIVPVTSRRSTEEEAAHHSVVMKLNWFAPQKHPSLITVLMQCAKALGPLKTIYQHVADMVTSLFVCLDDLRRTLFDNHAYCEKLKLSKPGYKTKHYNL